MITSVACPYCQFNLTDDGTLSGQLIICPSCGGQFQKLSSVAQKSDDDSFNPYHKWLGISPLEPTPTYYRLLGVTEFETDPTVIEIAADRQMSHLRTFQSGPRAAYSQQLLNEISTARSVLLDSAKKAAYDCQIQSPANVSTPFAVPVATPTQAIDYPSPVKLSNTKRKKKGANPAVEFIKIAVGGIFGIFMAILFLFYFAGVDLLGWQKKPPAGNVAVNDTPQHSRKVVDVQKTNLDQPPIRIDNQKNPPPPITITPTPPTPTPPTPTPPTPTPPTPTPPTPPTLTSVERRILEQLTMDGFRKELLGTWKISREGYEGVWTLRDDGSVWSNSIAPQGNWILEREKKRVLIRWGTDGKCWDAFSLPIDPLATTGDTWVDRPLKAVKLPQTADVSTPPAIGNKPQSHPADAVQFGKHWYKLIPASVNWDDAQRQCQAMGGYLVCVETEGENKFVKKLIGKRGRIWYGGIKDEKGEWRWVNGNKILFNGWAKGEPNNAGGIEDRMLCSSLYPGWSDYRNTNDGMEGFICEWEF